MQKQDGLKVELYSEKAAHRMAQIMGPFSASALALIELERRRALGEDVVLLMANDKIIIGPSPKYYNTTLEA